MVNSTSSAQCGSWAKSSSSLRCHLGSRNCQPWPHSCPNYLYVQGQVSRLRVILGVCNPLGIFLHDRDVMLVLDGREKKHLSFHSEVIIQLSEGGDICYEELQLNYNLIRESNIKDWLLDFLSCFGRRWEGEGKGFDIRSWENGS